MVKTTGTFSVKIFRIIRDKIFTGPVRRGDNLSVKKFSAFRKKTPALISEFTNFSKYLKIS